MVILFAQRLNKLETGHVFHIFGAGPERMDEGVAWSVDWLARCNYD